MLKGQCSNAELLEGIRKATEEKRLLEKKNKERLDFLEKRATPMRPTKRINYMVTCPSCQDFLVDYRAVDKPNFCSHCGQSIDWGDEK